MSGVHVLVCTGMVLMSGVHVVTHAGVTQASLGSCECSCDYLIMFCWFVGCLYLQQDNLSHQT